MLHELKPVEKIMHQTIDQLQIIRTAMEMGEARMVLAAIKRVHTLADEMRLEVMGLTRSPLPEHQRGPDGP